MATASKFVKTRNFSRSKKKKKEKKEKRRKQKQKQMKGNRLNSPHGVLLYKSDEGDQHGRCSVGVIPATIIVLSWKKIRKGPSFVLELVPFRYENKFEPHP